MTSILPQPLHISTPFPSTHKPHPPKPHKVPIPHALDESDNPPEKNPATSTASFESRLAQVRVKYRSGTGKKAEQRKAKKSGTTSTNKNKAVTLPPVPLKEAVTKDGLKVELGFSPYSERLNGRLAALGLVALVLVELGSGKGILKFHAAPTIFLQVYTVSAAAAVFIKYEKERTSVWPKKPEADAESETSAVIGDSD